ncbi:hypothetical protein FGO68_gene2928 [Halteria grandinella]|uniref:Uncharacterized protein n=1 Tax=Halteria grandinella TaxID=5974 RepID=A0A8J8SW74_HALGN|nr:hypothetical protein FGO68_gene2928 [Halteria grandinella]
MFHIQVETFGAKLMAALFELYKPPLLLSIFRPFFIWHLLFFLTLCLDHQIVTDRASVFPFFLSRLLFLVNDWLSQTLLRFRYWCDFYLISIQLLVHI